ncbi:AAA family ATPase [Halopseudomonas pachastrellae]|uniref:AAA family ATPase n=1 Tax=Halopseudomonas pachastrellae TaxID=254161 RepID=UPI003D7D963F|tara:strand:- start:7815 stop:8999 length:1185 start_codon:yes stop_codon:yes gene_type:complete
MEHTFLSCTASNADLEWLEAALAPLGQLLRVGETFDELLGMLDATGASLVFIGVDRDHLTAQCALIESLIEARPLLAVVALGDGFDNQLVIGAMRAGARDFITFGLRSSEVLGLVRRLTRRLPQLPVSRDQGALTLLYGAQPDPDAALVASHLALGLQREQRVLFVDLGVPHGESMDILGLEMNFVFADAVRNMRRLDSNLIDSAFTRHPSGLRVLPLGRDNTELEHFNSSELFLLLGALRQNFDQVVVNLCGQRDSEVLRTFISNGEALYWYIDQSVSNCRRNLELLQAWRDKGLKMASARLLVDRYLDGVAPDLKALARTYELPVAASFAHSPAVRLNVKNQGRAVFDLAPRDPLGKALSRFAATLAQPRAGAEPAAAGSPGLLGRLLGSAR